MLAKIHKWGSDLGLRLPVALAAAVGMDAGSTVEVTVDRGRLVVSPFRRPAERLEDLVAGITDANRHDEIPTSETTGHEAW